MNKEGTDLATFSNFGNQNAEIAAPGHMMVINGVQNSGTSFSAPLVTGAVALILGHYKTQGIVVSPAQVEIALLAGSKIIPDLLPRVKNGLSLNLVTLQNQLRTKSLVEVPASKLDVDGFWYTRDGASMTYGIRTSTTGIDINDPTLHIGIYEKLDPSLPPLAELPAHNGIDNFQLPFYNFLVGDEGIWIVLYRLTSTNKRIFISSKFYSFVDLIKNPLVNDTTMLGDLNQVTEQVKGWACLSGRPDHVKIEARINSPQGPVDQFVVTKVQPKGREYFNTCAPFVVTLGFEIPLTSLKVNTPYYFVAVHPTDAAKNKLLNADAIIIETMESAPPVLHSLKKSITPTTISLQGSVCWVNQTEPGIILNHISNPDIYSSPILTNWIVSVLQKQTELYQLFTQLQFYLGWGHMFDPHRLYDSGAVDYRSWTVATDKTKFSNYSVTNYINANNIPVPPIVNGLIDIGWAGIMRMGTVVDNSTIRQWFVDIDQANLTSVAENGHGLMSPYFYDHMYLNHDTITTTVKSNLACTSISQTGLGENFTISIPRAKLFSLFNITDKDGITVSFPVPIPNITDAQINTYATQFKDLFQIELAANGNTIINNVINSGEFIFSLKVLPHSANGIVQDIKLNGIPNL